MISDADYNKVCQTLGKHQNNMRFLSALSKLPTESFGKIKIFIEKVKLDETDLINLSAAFEVVSHMTDESWDMGINIGLRISDLLKLRVYHVLDKDYVELKEQKTGKYKRFPITDSYADELKAYIKGMDPDDWLFPSQRGDKPLTRIQAYRIFNRACNKVGVKINIGTHTLRKTFGYHFYRKNKDIALLQKIFNHSTPAVTLGYIGISQEIIDESLQAFSL